MNKMKKSQKQAMAIGGGIAALVAAAAGVYMMTGKNAKNRKKVADWASKMQKDVIGELGKAEKATQSTYNNVVDTVAEKYEHMKNVNGTDLAMAAMELKKHWDSIKAEMSGAATVVRKVAPSAKKSVSEAVKVTTSPTKRTAAKKVVKKTASKK